MKKFNLLFLTVFIAACGDSNKAQFVQGCTQGYISEEICECVYDEIKDELGESKHWKDAMIYDQTGFFKVMAKATVKCEDK